MVDWTQPLTRTLTLKSGERLLTLHDAADLFTRIFGSVTKSAPLEHAIRLLTARPKPGRELTARPRRIRWRSYCG